MEDLKIYVCSAIGFVGGTIVSLLGGWDSALATLICCIVLDYLTGLIVAGVFNNSNKTETGALESRAGRKGLYRKIMIVLLVGLAYRLDLLLGTDYIRYTVIIGFISNEVLSLIENAGLMGVPIPNVIKRAVDVLKNKESNKNG